jgi:2-phosphoglycolate phosphatase
MTLRTVAGEVKAVLFDLDGTLIDSAPDLGSAADKMRRDRGLPSLPDAAYRPMAGAGARGMLSVAFGIGPDSAEFAAMREEFFTNYEQCMTQRTYVFDGVGAMLRQLEAQGVAWGVVTNKSKRFTEPLAAQMPLFAHAAVVISGDTTPHAKPHPEPLLEAARRLGLEPSQCVYVGDDERDIQAARAAGMYSVAACYGYLGARADTALWGADMEIKSPDQLLQSLSGA